MVVTGDSCLIILAMVSSGTPASARVVAYSLLKVCGETSTPAYSPARFTIQ